MDILNLNKQQQEYVFDNNQQIAPSAPGFDWHEENLHQVLHSLYDEALQQISFCNFLKAISSLLHCEEILEAVTAKGELTDIDEVIVLLNNLALCYQRIGEVDKALAYLDGSLYNLKLLASRSSLKNDIKLNSIASKTSLQSCAMISQKNMHKSALKFARNSRNFIVASLSGVIKAYNKHCTMKTEKICKKPKQSKSAQNLIKIIEKFITTGVISSNIKYRVIIPEWANELAISDIMLVQPSSLSQIKDKYSLHEEFSLDSLLYKIALLACSHYCIATEMNYIKNFTTMSDVNEFSIDKEYRDALAILSTCFSTNSKLFIHVYEGFLKNCCNRKSDKEILEKDKSIIGLAPRKQCLTPTPPEIMYKSQKAKTPAGKMFRSRKEVTSADIPIGIEGSLLEGIKRKKTGRRNWEA